MTEYEVVADYATEIGESPLWHPEEEIVEWVDIPSGRIFSYDPETDESEFEAVVRDNVIGAITLQKDGSKLLFMDEEEVRVLRGKETDIVSSSTKHAGRFNDVIADPEGRVFCGSLSGSLYRLDTDGTLTEVVDGVGFPNGMGFSPDLEYMYFTDSHGINRFEYDRATGELSNQELFFEEDDDETAHNGLDVMGAPSPDGLTVDSEGYVWTCLFGGDGILRLTPEGEEDRRYHLPVNSSTSLTFGGPDFSDIYVTTGFLPVDIAGENDPLAGTLYRFSPEGVNGKAEFLSDVSP